MGPAGKRTLIALLMIAGLSQNAHATTFTVGGNTGWTLGISPTFYDDWAKAQTFAVGDVLDFSYVGTAHNVFAVSAADLASCSLTAPLKTFETAGGASVTLTTAGTHYYICGIPGHCLANMKITIVVSPSAVSPAAALTPASAPTSAPTPAASAPTPAPTTAAPTPLKAATPVPAAVEAPGPSPARKGAASSLSGGRTAVIAGAVLCVVTALLL